MQQTTGSNVTKRPNQL